MRIATDTLIDGRYRLIEKIGSGGMADVWRADDQHLGRTVALKLLHERFAQDKGVRRALPPRGLLGRRAPAPQRRLVFDRGEFEGTYYIAMEFLEGARCSSSITSGMGTQDAIDFTARSSPPPASPTARASSTAT